MSVELQRVSLREINQRLTRYVKAAEAGERIVITRRGKPIALLSALPPQERPLDAAKEAAVKAFSAVARSWASSAITKPAMPSAAASSGPEAMAAWA